MSWPLVKLSLHLEKILTWNPVKSEKIDLLDYVDLSAVDKDKKVIDTTLVSRISPIDAPSRARQIIAKGDVLVSTVRPNLNGVALALPVNDGAIASTGYCVLRPKITSLDSKYLFFWVQTRAFVNDMVAKATGANYPAVSDRIVKESEIPLPPLPIQKQIAAALEKADSLRQQCQQMEQELNALAQSVFLEMFGDPVTNSKKWPTSKFAALGELNRGKSKHRPRNDPKLLGGIYPLIQTGDVARADNYITEYKHTYSEFGLKQSRLWKKGTLCITIAANIADTAILGFDSCFPDSVVGFNANKNITSNMFVHYWLKFYQIILERTAPESAQKNINLKILEALDIFVPPLCKQNEFIDILNQIESQKSVCREATKNLENNFNSLMQRAFKGELHLTAPAKE